MSIIFMHTPQLTLLTQLNLERNDITDISALSSVTNLEFLNIGRNAVDDLSPVANLSYLRSLSIHSNNISDISPLAGLAKLDTLNLANNRITDILPLAGLSNLQFLDLSVNGISDISPLTGLTQLNTLLVFANPIQDWSPMCLIMDRNPISRVEPAGIVAELLCDPPADPDVNDDGKVDVSDLMLVLSGLITPSDLSGDVDQDGAVTVADLLIVIDSLDDPVGATAPPIGTEAIAMDAETFEMALNRLRLESDGSLRYRQAIALIENLMPIVAPPDNTELLANYPNPFNPETWIPYHLADAADVRLVIYDIYGKVVRRFDLGVQPAGRYTDKANAVYWDGRNRFNEPVGSGVYFYHLQAGDYSSTRRLVILK